MVKRKGLECGLIAVTSGSGPAGRGHQTRPVPGVNRTCRGQVVAGDTCAQSAGCVCAERPCGPGVGATAVTPSGRRRPPKVRECSALHVQRSHRPLLSPGRLVAGVWGTRK